MLKVKFELLKNLIVVDISFDDVIYFCANGFVCLIEVYPFVKV